MDCNFLYLKNSILKYCISLHMCIKLSSSSNLLNYNTIGPTELEKPFDYGHKRIKILIYMNAYSYYMPNNIHIKIKIIPENDIQYQSIV